MAKECALMGCELPDGWKTIGEQSKNHEDEKVKDQCKLLMEHGFKPTDMFCDECFWK